MLKNFFFHPSTVFAGLVCLLFVFNFSCQKAENSARPRQAEPSAEAAPAPAATISESQAKKRAAADALAPLESPAPEAMSSSAAAAGKFDALKKFVREADLRFRTRDVLETTLDIERIVVQNGGFVSTNRLTNDHHVVSTRKLDADSALQITSLNPRNNLVFRVPYENLDTTLRSLGRYVVLLDFRQVSAEDVGLQHLENQLTALRERLHAEAMNAAAEASGGKPRTAIEAREIALRSQANADAEKIENLKLEDRIRYATVKVELYQQPVFRQERIARTDIFETPRPGFAERAGSALLTGWRVLESIFIGVLNLWSILLLAGLAWFFVFKKLKIRKLAH